MTETRISIDANIHSESHQCYTFGPMRDDHGIVWSCRRLRLSMSKSDIANQGEGEAGPATHQVRLVIRRPGATDIDVLLGTVTTGPLAPGASQSFTVPIRLPQEVPTGTALIRVMADSGGTVSESNEENNTAEVQITITGGP